MAKTTKTEARKALELFDTKNTGTLTAPQQAARDRLYDTVRADDFKRLAEIRGNRALKAIDGLAALAKPARYAYTSEQVLKLEKAFKDALGNCFAAFEGKKTKTGGLSL